MVKIAESYMSASAQHDREWEEEKVRDTWAQSVKNAGSIEALRPLIA